MKIHIMLQSRFTLYRNNLLIDKNTFDIIICYDLGNSNYTFIDEFGQCDDTYITCVVENIKNYLLVPINDNILKNLQQNVSIKIALEDLHIYKICLTVNGKLGMYDYENDGIWTKNKFESYGIIKSIDFYKSKEKINKCNLKCIYGDMLNCLTKPLSSFD